MYEKYDGRMEHFGDDSLTIVGHGRVFIRFFEGGVKGTNRVFHILALAQNLLLVNTLDVGVQVVFLTNGISWSEGMRGYGAC